MEIKNYKDLNALNKLLFKIKFSEELSFEEFQMFAESTIISDIMVKLNKEYREQSNEHGFLMDHEIDLLAEQNGDIERVVKKRLEIVGSEGIQRLDESSELENYILSLFSPFKVEPNHIKKIKEFALDLRG